jgi:hydroxyethylthiazole kinase
LSAQIAAAAGDLLVRMREARPRVHCITNSVVQGFTANVLLAAGAIPSMTMSANEIGYFVSGASALLVNLGTFDDERREAIGIAVAAANDGDIPWLLDPVFIQRSPPRAEYARELAGMEPRVVRANAAEFEALSKRKTTPESLDRFALDHITVAACTGPVDLVTSGTKRANISNGHAWMAQVTGIGCAETALMAALVSVEDDEFLAASAALLIASIAGEVAAERANGPGSFAVELIDALASLDPATISRRANISLSQGTGG